MPKGDHFKKANPRNYQVSFKVNKTELEQLRMLAEEKNVSIPEWLRSHIHAKEMTEQPRIIKESVVSKPAKKVSKPKPTSKQDKDDSAGQTSLF